ncbi:MAG: amidohydrolase [Planctomycetes bacterium]|nr:amidohydrolase [Planctomycetota bacterium]
MLRRPRLVLLAAATLLLLGAPPAPAQSDDGSGPSAPPADLLFLHGTVRTLDDTLGAVEALAVRDGRIVFVGADAEAEALAGSSTRVIDLAGRTLLPGFVDSHLHLAGLADMLAEIDLVGTRSYDEVVAKVADAAASAAPGTWLLGRGWDQNDWPAHDFPEHAALSAAVPGHPVLLTRIDGHALLCNAAALERAGVTRDTPAPSGGRILHDADGEPTGVFVDDAMDLLRAVVPPTDPSELATRIQAAIGVLHRFGVTGIHDAGVPWSTIELYAALDRAGRFPLRDHVMVAAADPVLQLAPARSGLPTSDLTGSGHLAVRAIKLSVDGALGSRGAALLSDYSDDPGNRGLLTASAAQTLQLARFALAGGWQLCTHAIGDRANRMVLDAYAAAFAEDPDAARDARFRVEHAQVLAPSDLPRFAALGVIPSMQAQHCTSDMPWATARLGRQRARGAYAWADLLASGVVIPGGSDAPVEVPDPLRAFWAAVTRTDAQGRPPGGWHPEQRMTRVQALLHLTRWPAFAAFDEARTGALRPGMAADLVVLSGDPLTLDDDALLGLRVELTVVDGKVVYTAEPAPTR